MNDELYMKLRDRASKRTDDVVWHTGDFFEIPRAPENRRGYGVDKARGSRLSRLCRIGIKTFIGPRQDKGNYFQLRQVNRRSTPVTGADIAYQNITQVLTEIENRRFVIASRLRFGMTAWSLGVPAYLVMPLQKARIAWNEAGLQDYIYDSVTGAVCGTRRALKQQTVISPTIQDTLAQRNERARVHFDFLEDQLKRC